MEPPKQDILAVRTSAQAARSKHPLARTQRDAVVTIRSHANGLDALGVRQVETALDKITKREKHK